MKTKIFLELRYIDSSNWTKSKNEDKNISGTAVYRQFKLEPTQENCKPGKKRKVANDIGPTVPQKLIDTGKLMYKPGKKRKVANDIGPTVPQKLIDTGKLM
ncbi:hypothetical protein QE152_g4170 [Popillia japonica]|uniref:Uncharacterized protein n=1 Tax=Popillia japonica TaxID=7064 RepID=A0AAW1N1L8_POPJA